MGVLDIATRTVEGSIAVGAGPVGLDVTPDGTRLYVCNYDGNTISVVDTATRQQVSTIAIPPAPGPGRPASIAILANGTALVSVDYNTVENGGTIQVLNLATDVMTRRPDIVAGPDAAVTSVVKLRRSLDRTTVAFVNPIGNDSYTTVYKVATDAFTTKNLTNLANFPDEISVSADGSRLLVDGINVLDDSLHVIGNVSPPITVLDAETAAFAPTGSIAYRPIGRTLQTLDVDGLAVEFNREIGGVASSPSWVEVTPDGSKTLVAVNGGIAVIDL